MAKQKPGRKSVDTPETRRRLEEAAALDASVDEMAFYADIHRDSYYEIIKKDKVFSDRIAALRNRPIMQARQTIVNSVKSDPHYALEYLKRKRRIEFGDSVDINAKVEQVVTATPEAIKLAQEYEQKLKDKLSTSSLAPQSPMPHAPRADIHPRLGNE